MITDSEYIQMNLHELIKEIGEDSTKKLLSSFSCEKNADVQNFIKHKACEFSKQGLAKTFLIYLKTKESVSLVGFFSLSQKTITVDSKALNSKHRSKIRKFSEFDENSKCFTLPVILIGQLGKNFTDGNDKKILGDELLKMALDKTMEVQRMIGGKFVFLECENNQKVLDFYIRNGFRQFGERELDGDETDIRGTTLLQLIKFLEQ